MVIRPNVLRYKNKREQIKGEKFERLAAEAEINKKHASKVIPKQKNIIMVGVAVAFFLPLLYFEKLRLNAKSFNSKQKNIDIVEERKESSILLKHYEDIVPDDIKRD